MKYTLLSLLIASLLSFCSAPKTSGETPPSLVGTHWQLESYQPSGGALQAAVNDEARLSFNANGGIGGNTGCNSMGGDYSQTGNQLSIQVFSTKMYCEAFAKQENTINETMREAMTVSMADGKLILTRAGAKLVYKKAAPPKAATSSNTPDTYDNRTPANATPQPATATDKSGTTQRISGLFRYMADAANFMRCSDNQRFAVAMEGNFLKAEQAYTKMGKAGEAAYMVFEADIVKNPGEGHPQMLVIREVVSSSQSSECE